MEIGLSVNGKKRRVDVPPMKRLLDTLREDLGLTGTKEGCGEGECGACSVSIDDEVVNACLVATCQAEGADVTTIEGVGKKRLSKLQEAFLACGAAQCGICTPGMILAASVLPKRPTLDEIRAGLAGNLCRCTGYTRIYEAVREALGGPRDHGEAKAPIAPADLMGPIAVAAEAVEAAGSTRSIDEVAAASRASGDGGGA